MSEGLHIDIRRYIPEASKELLSGLSKEDVDKYIRRSLQKSCRLIRDYARTHHRYENDTGRLTRAIRYKLLDRAKKGVTAKGERYKAEVYLDEKEAPYGVYQHEGTDSPIKPVHKSRLVFFSRRYGRKVVVMQVRGLVKDQFLYRARKNTRLEVLAIFEEELRGLINGN